MRVNYRPILSGKFGSNCTSIPGCKKPLGFNNHSYVEIDGPEGDHTWGVLGITDGDPDIRGSDQEMVQDATDWDRDPLHGEAGVQSFVVSASDQDARDFKEALHNKLGPPYPDCPSCGKPYHNSILGSPRSHLHWQFLTAYNSNTFTWNVIKNFLHVTPDPISSAPGYHVSSGYKDYLTR